MAVTTFASLRTLDSAYFVDRRSEASAVMTLHAQNVGEVRKATMQAVAKFVLNAVQWRSLSYSDNVEVKLHVQTSAKNFILWFPSTPSQAAIDATRHLSQHMRTWESVLGREGCVEIYVAATKQAAQSCGAQPHVDSLPYYNRYDEAQLERALVLIQGVSRWDSCAFDLDTLRPGHFFSSAVAREHFYGQYRRARQAGTAVRVPRPHHLAQPMRVEPFEADP